MAVKRMKPTTPGQRFRIANTFAELTTARPEKSLVAGKSYTGGRNNTGKMTMRYLGGGHKRRYRFIDFKRDKFGIEGTIKTVEYDPNRTAFIALVVYADGEKRYIIAPKGIQVGDKVQSGAGSAPNIGNTLPISEIPLGSTIHNIELNPGQGGRIVRTAGGSATLMAREGKYATIKLPSGETRMILTTCLATMGTVSNGDHFLENLGKAGRKRWLGRRPHNRGSAMNPVDHPMGGGEGRKKGGQARNRNGMLTKGTKTRNKKKLSSKYIIERKKK